MATSELPTHDARGIPDGSILRYDLCIVGSGVAGATTALGLAGTGLRVAVIEGGGTAIDAATTELLDLESSARRVELDTRERWLGGTSNAWTGGLTTLDDIDLAPRPWVPGSGWPMSPETLRALYVRAGDLLGRPGPDTFDPPHRHGDGFAFDSDDLHTVAFHNEKEPLRFGELLRERLGPASGVDLHVLANVTEVLLDEAG